MDIQTAQYYSENAAKLAEKYNSCLGGIDKYFSKAFEPRIKILDIGCGSGRDLNLLHKMGCQADGIDSCQAFIEIARKNTQQYDCMIKTESLPGLTSIPNQAYDGILCSAVLMHLPEEQLFDAAFTLRRILKQKGNLLLSIPLPDETIDPKTKRDHDNRLFNGLIPEKLQLLLERIGFKLLDRWDNTDALDREHRQWSTMLFELESATGKRPVDTIESILNKDAKVATYKLALFRSLANIATTNYNLAQWTNDGRVKISTQVLAEKWVEYYWPIIEAGIRQTTGRAVAFRKKLEDLVEYYRNRGSLSAFSQEYRNNQLTHEAGKLCKELLSKIKGTIWNQPVRYAGGGEDFSVMQYDRADKTILIGSDIWKELSLMGPWIQDATVLRWAELTARIEKDEIKPSAVIDCLLTVPIQERDVNVAKTFYDSLQGKKCVWTDKDISRKYDLDHAIPFSLWKNNDLWNLLPADSTVNGNKKDKLPTTPLVKARKDSIIHYWTLISNELPARFEYEASKLTGRQLIKTNWENFLFATFAEAVEITAIQRGIERWEPAKLAATGTENVYSQQDSGITSRAMEPRAEYNSATSKIIKIVSGAQTGADRGGLDAAIELGIPHGGWCPEGRLAEDGEIPEKYHQKEMTSRNYLKRTEQNVIDSTATVIFTSLPPTGGSLRTAQFAKKHNRSFLCVDMTLSIEDAVSNTTNWLKSLWNPGIILNVAGSRGSKAPELQEWVKAVMTQVLRETNDIQETEILYYNFNDIAEKSFSEFLPFVGELTAGATPDFGFFMENLEREAKDAEWLEVPTRFCKAKRFVIQVIGDSMEPTINKYDYIVCEYHRHCQQDHNVVIMADFSFNQDGESAVKRIQETENSWIFKSDNQTYKDIPIEKVDEMDEFPILGTCIYNLTKNKAIT